MPRDAITLTVNGKNKTAGMFRSLRGSLSSLGAGVVVANQAFSLINQTFQALDRTVRGVITPFADFQQETQNIRTLLQTTDSDFNKLKNGILDVARTTPKAISELTSATYDLISAGVAEENAIWALNKAQKAAVAGSTDTQVAVNGAMATINAYGLELSELTRVFDMQFNVVKRGVITFDQLAKNVGKVLPSARNLGANLEEVHAGMAILTKAGFNAEQATTVLARSFDALAKPATVENFKKVGLAIHDTDGQFRGMIPILNDLSAKLSTMNDAQRSELMGVLALEENALKGFSTLMAKVGEYDSSIAEMKGIGEMDRAHEQMATTWKNRWGTLTNAVKVAMINWVEDHASTVEYVLSSVEYVVGNIGLIVETIKVAFEGLYNVVKIVFNAITIGARALLFGIAALVDGLAQLISYIPGLPESWKTAVEDIRQFTTHAMGELIEGIVTDWGDIEDGISGTGEAIVAGVGLSEEWQTVVDKIKGGFAESDKNVKKLNLSLKKTDKTTDEVAKGTDSVEKSLMTSQEMSKTVGNTLSTSVAGGVGQVVQGMLAGKAAFKSVGEFAKAIAVQLAVAVAQAIALKAVMSMLGGIGFIFHQGGMVMHDGGMVKAHSGLLASDERMIIAQRGEAVLNRDAVNQIGGRPIIDYINRTKQLPARGGGGGGGNTLVIQVGTMIGTEDWVKNNLVPVLEAASSGGYSNIQLREEELDGVY